MLCAPCDRSGRSAWPEVAPGLTPDSIQQKYAQTVASSWITPGCVQFLADKKRFYTALLLSNSKQLDFENRSKGWSPELRRETANSENNGTILPVGSPGSKLEMATDIGLNCAVDLSEKT